MYKVYACDWSGCDEEPEKVFETLKEARKYVEEEDQYLTCEEYYIIEKDGKEVW